MAKIVLIRHRLLYILLLGVVTSALSLGALWRALNFSDAQRIERAREAVGVELDRFVELAPSKKSLAEQPATTYVGLRGGWVDRTDQVPSIEGLPAEWRPLLQLAAEESLKHRRSEPEARQLMNAPALSSTLVIGVAPTPTGGLAWAGVLLAPSAYLRPWRRLAFGIAAATLLLVATTLASVTSFRRQTRALLNSLVVLGKNLRTPVPRPTLAELGQLADGIARLAADLLASREDTERLLRELAQKERLAALGRVAAGVAHEVRNPLAAIKLRLDLAAATHGLPAPTQHAVSAASNEIARLDRLVGDLLVVAGRNPGPSQHVDLGALVSARAETLAPWAETHGVRITVRGDSGAQADPESLARAIDNLLRNAVEASPRGEQVIAHVDSADGKAILRVEDAGQGVDPSRDAELFEPFFTTKPEGTGLGLALSRAIARAHGGDLVYERHEGKTCFVLDVPTMRSVEAAA